MQINLKLTIKIIQNIGGFNRPNALCTPGMGVNLWGESPLYVNLRVLPAKIRKVLAEGNCGRATDRGKEAGEQDCEPTNRNSI